MTLFLRRILLWSAMWLAVNATQSIEAQEMPLRYATLELFTNTPCPICGSQNPGFFSRLSAYEGLYHLISFYPGKPYSSCIFYQANIPENAARFQFYSGHVFGTPTVVLNGTQFKSSGSVSNAVLDGVTGSTSWLSINVTETPAANRDVQITLKDHAGGSLDTGTLFAVIVEKQIMYTAPNGETIHRNVFRKFLTAVDGEKIDMSSGEVTKSYQYTLNPTWQADQTYVIAWLMDPQTKEIYNSGTRFDPGMTSATGVVVEENAINLYPNPANDDLNIELPEGPKNISLRIYDATGKLISSVLNQGEKIMTLCTAEFPAGFYFIKMDADGTSFVSRFVVNH